MQKKYKQLLSSSKAAGELKQDQFFTDGHVYGYMSKEETLAYARSLTTGQQDQLDLFFDYTVEGYSITSLPIESDDKETGEVVMWVKFQLPNSPQRFRMVYHPGLLQFIKDYQQGKVKPTFSFDQLIEEALKIEEEQS